MIVDEIISNPPTINIQVGAIFCRNVVSILKEIRIEILNIRNAMKPSILRNVS